MNKRFLILGLMVIILFQIFSPSVSGYNYYSDTSDELCGWYLLWFVIWLAVGLWAKKDAEERGEGGVKWFLVVFILGIFGLLIWLAVRPSNRIDSKNKSDRRCPSCGRIIPEDANVCPYCGKKFW